MISNQDGHYYPIARPWWYLYANLMRLSVDSVYLCMQIRILNYPVTHGPFLREMRGLLHSYARSTYINR